MDDIRTDAKTLIRLHNRRVSNPSIAIMDLQVLRVARKVLEQADRIEYLERLLSRAYPWLHNPYHGTTDIANAAEGDAVIEAVQTAIQHVPDEPDPLLRLPCASCDGAGRIGALICPNCAPISER